METFRYHADLIGLGIADEVVRGNLKLGDLRGLRNLLVDQNREIIESCGGDLGRMDEAALVRADSSQLALCAVTSALGRVKTRAKFRKHKADFMRRQGIEMDSGSGVWVGMGMREAKDYMHE